MSFSSIHFEPLKQNSELINKRICIPDYCRSDLSNLNESWEIMSVADASSLVKKTYEENKGQRMQKKSIPIREGVVVLEAHHNIEDLKKLGQVLETKYGIRLIQAYVQRDCGHYDIENIWRPNLLHGHMIFIWYDKVTCKSVKLNRQDLREIQTIVANSLGMARGVSSYKKHLNALQFKIKSLQEMYDLLLIKYGLLEKELKVCAKDKKVAQKDLREIYRFADEKRN